MSVAAPSSHGFTLIELLVVLFIVGITLGFALLSFGDFGEKRRVIVASEQFVAYVKFVQYQAILNATSFRITVTQKGYNSQQLSPSNHWIAVPSSRSIRYHAFPKNTHLQVIRGTKKQDKLDLVINASGDMTAFILEVGTLSNPSIATIIGHHNGTLSTQITHP